MAMASGCGIKANMSLGAYEINVPTSEMAEPVWPDLPFQELRTDRLSRPHDHELDHPVVKRLRGLA